MSMHSCVHSATNNSDMNLILNPNQQLFFSSSDNHYSSHSYPAYSVPLRIIIIAIVEPLKLETLLSTS